MDITAIQEWTSSGNLKSQGMTVLQRLDMLYDSLPDDKPKIVIGDFNAKIGKETIYKPTIGSESLHEESNVNGYKLISFAGAKNMTLSSTCFPHKNIHKQTWISPCGYVRNQIDHIIVDSRIKSCIRDERSMRGSSSITAEEVLGYIPEKTRKMWFNEECKRALHEKDRARMKVLHEPNEDNKRLLALKQREVKKVIRSNKRLWEKERIQNMENNRNSHSKIYFRKANEGRHGYKPRPNVMRKSDGTLLTGNKEITCEFKDMFAKLLNQSIINIIANELTTVKQLLEAPSKNELEMGLNMLKNGKAPGVDEIVSECLKKGGPCLLDQLLKLINIIWEQEEIPESWRVSVLCPVFKKGDIMECENYRGISLLNTTYKILSNILLIKINPYIKEIIGEYQAGFMIGRSTVDQIHIIKQLAEKSHEFNKDIHLMFIDYKAAYDSINREKL
ncbi:hypothetical protein QTP88_016908 [Uroleucon formosanum]